jgi:nucleotide-binding universal stress UspA family protein
MQVFTRIVAAVDNDQSRASQVITVAREMGERFHSEVLVVHVRDVERPASIAAAGRPGALQPTVHFETEERAEQLVNEAVDSLRGGGVRARGQVSPGAGSTARELLEIADSFGANLIVAGDRDSRVSDVLLGGVAHRIVHLAKCPVLLVR